MADSNQFEIKVLRTLEEAEHWRAAWSAMQRDPESDIDFVSFIVSVRFEIIRPHVLVVLQAGNPVALLAGRLENSHFEIKLGYRVLWRVPVRRLAVFYGGFMGQITPEITELVVRHLLRSLAEEKADLLMWSGIQIDTGLHKSLNHIPNPLCRDYLTRPVSRWLMSLPASLEELLEKRMNKKHRYWAKRAMRLLEKDFPGAVRYHCFSTPNEVGQLFEDALKVARKTYQWGLGVGFQDNEEQRRRLALEAANGWLRGQVLYLKDEPVAFWVFSIYQDTVYSDYTGFDPQYRKYEVGTALFLRMIGEACQAKVKQLDFGPGSAFYKERFGDTEFKEAVLCVFAFTFRGVFLNGVRMITEGPSQLVRGLLRSVGLEQKVKKLWRNYLTPAATKGPAPEQA